MAGLLLKKNEDTFRIYWTPGVISIVDYFIQHHIWNLITTSIEHSTY